MKLGIDVTTLDCIEEREKDGDKRLLEMLKHWLRNGPDRSWNALEEALRQKTVARPDVAERLSK